MVSPPNVPVPVSQPQGSIISPVLSPLTNVPAAITKLTPPASNTPVDKPPAPVESPYVLHLFLLYPFLLQRVGVFRQPLNELVIALSSLITFLRSSGSQLYV